MDTSFIASLLSRTISFLLIVTLVLWVIERKRLARIVFLVVTLAAAVWLVLDFVILDSPFRLLIVVRAVVVAIGIRFGYKTYSEARMGWVFPFSMSHCEECEGWVLLFPKSLADFLQKDARERISLGGRIWEASGKEATTETGFVTIHKPSLRDADEMARKKIRPVLWKFMQEHGLN